MATDTHLLEAERLVNISLCKIAESRNQRTDISLYKSLLVTTVLQKARFLCMEEIFCIVPSSPKFNDDDSNSTNCFDYQNNYLDGLTFEEAGLTQTSNYVSHPESSGEKYDEETAVSETRTYFDLDKAAEDQCFKEHSEFSRVSSSYSRKLRKRKTVYDVEFCGNIRSTLHKKRILEWDSDNEDSVFDDVFLYSDPNEIENSMDVAKITSLISIFAFRGISPTSETNINESSSDAPSDCSSYSSLSLIKSSSAPDLCSSQAKNGETIKQRPFMTMKV